jgi:hypothetical protein
VGATISAGEQGGGEVEIEFDSELGRVFVLREGDNWRCSVQLAGQGAEGAGMLDSNGERDAAYQCFEYLSHLLKHDNLFPGELAEADESEAPQDEAASQDADGEATQGKARRSGRRKKRR